MKKSIFAGLVMVVGLSCLCACDEKKDIRTPLPVFDEAFIKGKWNITQIDTMTTSERGLKVKKGSRYPTAMTVSFDNGIYKIAEGGTEKSNGTYAFNKSLKAYAVYLIHGAVTDTLKYLKSEDNKMLKLRLHPDRRDCFELYLRR